MTHPAPLPPAGFSMDMPAIPEPVSLPEPQREQVLAILAKHAGKPGALLPVLHAVQDALGCIPPAAVPEIAQGLTLSRAEVHGVITFYPHFRTTPAGRHHVELCRAEACQAMGAGPLAEQVAQRLGCAPGATSPDGRYTLSSVYCLGLCAQSPAMMIDGQPHARLTPRRFEQIIATLEEQA